MAVWRQSYILSLNANSTSISIFCHLKKGREGVFLSFLFFQYHHSTDDYYYFHHTVQHPPTGSEHTSATFANITTALKTTTIFVILWSTHQQVRSTPAPPLPISPQHWRLLLYSLYCGAPTNRFGAHQRHHRQYHHSTEDYYYIHYTFCCLFSSEKSMLVNVLYTSINMYQNFLKFLIFIIWII